MHDLLNRIKKILGGSNTPVGPQPGPSPVAQQHAQQIIASTVKRPVTIDTSGGLWNRIQSAIFTPLAKVQTSIEKPSFEVPKFHFADDKKGVVGFGLNIGQDLLNTPSNYAEGIVNAGVGLSKGNGRRALKGVGQIGGSLLNVGTFGTGGALAKEAGSVGLKQLVKEGAIEGGKYGLGYGAAGGLVSHSNAPTVGDQLLQSIPDTLLGGVTGTVLGGGIAGGIGVLGKLKGSLTKEVEKEVTKVSHANIDTPTKQKVLVSLLNETEAQTKARRAEGLTAIQKYGGTKDTINFNESYRDWVNARRATSVEGTIAARKFEPLREEGMAAIDRFQKGDRSGLLGEAEKYFNSKYQQEVAAGLPINYKKNYLPQLWENSEDEVRVVMGRTLTSKPGFSLKSVLRDYQEGIDKGLTPRFNSIPDLVKSYEASANKAIADKNFFDTLTKTGYIVPRKDAPATWVTLDPDRFPKLTQKTARGTYEGNYAAPKELGESVNNYLKQPASGILDFTANISSAMKNLSMNSGIPNVKANPLNDYIGGTNFHTINITARHILFSKNLTELFTGLKYIANRKAARAYIDDAITDVPRMIKAGLNISSNDKTILYSQADKNLVTKTGNKLDELFSEPLFGDIIPALKAQHFKSIEADMVKGGVSPKEASREAAIQVNNIFGGINLEQLGRSKDTQNFFRSVLLAPDWAESTLNIGTGTAKALLNPRDPKGKVYREGVRNLLLAYTSLNVLNYMSSGHLMINNDAGHEFDLEVGYTNDGQKRYIRPLGTAVDFVRLPYTIASSIAKGDTGKTFSTIRNRLSPLAGQLVGQLSNTNYYGGQIAKPSDTGLDEVKARVADFSQSVTPAFISSPIQYATGQVGAEQAVTRSLELPVSYSGGPFSKTQKAATEGLTGKERHDLSKELKGESLSKNQLAQLQALVNSGYSGEDALNTILYKRRLEGAQKSILEGNGATLPKLPTASYEDPLIKDIAEEKAKAAEKKMIEWAWENAKSPTEVDMLLKQMGINKTYSETKSVMIAGLPTEEKAKYAWDELRKAPSNGEGYLKTVKTLIDQELLTSAVISQFEKEGKIDEDRKRSLNNAIKMVTGQKLIGLKKPRKPKAISLPKIKKTSYKKGASAPAFKPLKPITSKGLTRSGIQK